METYALITEWFRAYLAVLEHEAEDLPHWFRKDVSDVFWLNGSWFGKYIVESDPTAIQNQIIHNNYYVVIGGEEQ